LRAERHVTPAACAGTVMILAQFRVDAQQHLELVLVGCERELAHEPGAASTSHSSCVAIPTYEPPVSRNRRVFTNGVANDVAVLEADGPGLQVDALHRRTLVFSAASSAASSRAADPGLQHTPVPLG